MRTRLRVLALVGTLITGLPQAAAAEWHITPFFGFTFQGETTLLDYESAVGTTHWHFGSTLSLVGSGPIGVEGLVIYVPGFFQRDDPPAIGGVPPINVTKSRSIGLMGNLVLTTPRRWNEYGLRPFVSGGIGWLHASAQDASDVLPVSANLLGYNVGGGAVGFLTDRTGLRFDLRYFSNLKPVDDFETAIGRVQLSYWTASVGVVLRY